ncbi:MAG: hypothetical protein VX479_05205, partial [Verrucomicrobiota bacterium]|nr:hypothetical protein [Verrucomicrobiota bacterium]
MASSVHHYRAIFLTNLTPLSINHEIFELFLTRGTKWLKKITAFSPSHKQFPVNDGCVINPSFHLLVDSPRAYSSDLGSGCFPN